jgi:hypothetical protein
MIEIHYLKDDGKTGENGFCQSCGRKAAEDPKMISIRFEDDRRHHSVGLTLCSGCRKELYKKLCSTSG